MVPTEKDREEPVGDGRHGALRHLHADAPDCFEVANRFPARDDLRDGDLGVTMIRYLEPELFERRLDAGVPDGARPHVHPPTVLAEVHRNTKDPYRLVQRISQRLFLPTGGDLPPPRSCRPGCVGRR